MAAVECRARRAGYNCASTMKDMSNAFAGCSWVAMGAANSEIMPDDLRGLGEQRCRGAAINIRCRGAEEGVCV
eukprot:8870671-Pyramimonas_sp.AAC.1